MSNSNQFLNVPKTMFNITIIIISRKQRVNVCMLTLPWYNLHCCFSKFRSKVWRGMIMHTWAHLSPVITQVKCQLFLNGNWPLPSDRKEKLLKTFVGNYLVSWIMG